MSLLAALDRLASEIVTRPQLEALLARAASERRPLRVKFGIDPTFKDVHLGHAVPIRVLRRFQEHGHLPVLILGDATARLGDPTGRNDQRPALSQAEVEANAATYLDQIGRILDLDPARCEVRRNGEWFRKMDFFDGLKLAAQATLARMLERDDFSKRMRENLPLHLHEMMYPLMQGWDSVQVRADVELGGNDQLFNLHMGRQLQERAGQPPQVCLTTPLLLGTDGRKMSKTYGNHVPLNAPAEEVYGKVMSLADEGMPEWFRLATDLPEERVATLLGGHPRAAKDALARAVTAQLHGEAAAAAASAEFVRRFREGGIPAEIAEQTLPAGEHALAWVIAQALGVSSTEARRLIEGGGIKLDGEPVADPHARLALVAGGVPRLIQAGKRRFARVRAD
jgi:tyrosyl-tRNA synthetase